MSGRAEQVERQKRKPEIKYFFTEPTQLSNLGIEIGIDKLNLTSDTVAALRSEDPADSSQRFYVFLHRPLAGEPLSQFLRSIAPYSEGNKSGIQADLRMPIRAARKISQGQRIDKDDREYGDIPLHRDHKRDPEITKEYLKLLKTGEYSRILRALYHSSADSVFDGLSHLVFTRSKKDYVSRFLAECEDALEQEDEDREAHVSAVVWNYNELHNDTYILPFRQFLLRQSEFQSEFQARGKFRDLSIKRRCELIKQFINTLTDKQKRKLTQENISYTEYSFKIRADLETKEFSTHGDMEWGLPDLRFIDDQSVKVTNWNGASAVVKPSVDKHFGQVDWQIVNYQYPPDYHTGALYPVLAWGKNSSGKRRFLEQADCDPVIRTHFGYAKWADVKLGEILAAYLSPRVLEGWSRRMELKNRKHLQHMMGAQMLVWPKIDSKEHPHATQLLNDERAVIPKIEAILETKAA